MSLAMDSHGARQYHIIIGTSSTYFITHISLSLSRVIQCVCARSKEFCYREELELPTSYLDPRLDVILER